MAEVMGVMIERVELERRIELIRLDEQFAREQIERLKAELAQAEKILERTLGMRQECEYWLSKTENTNDERA